MEMHGAEFRTLREHLGFSREDFAALVSTSVHRVVEWDQGRAEIPPRVIETLRMAQAEARALTLGMVTDAPAVLLTYRTDEDFRRATGSAYPASWHRSAVAQAMQHLPGVTVEFISTAATPSKTLAPAGVA